jgi:hypothetical protein
MKMRHIIPISGKDSLATAIVQTTREPRDDYEFMFNPTGQEPPEVFDWIRRVGQHFGKEVNMVGEDLEAIIELKGWFLPSRIARYCTRESKIIPMETFIGKVPAFVYYGIRADENRGGYDNSSFKNIIPIYPLKEVGMGINGVYAINHSVGLKPPTFFWQRLYDEVCYIVGGGDKALGEAYIKATFTEWQIDSLFAWRSRTNCTMCFNQRKYEWVGLLWHHPELFRKYEGWEHNVSEYYLAGQNYPLTKIEENAEKIFKRRVRALAKFIEKTRQIKMFTQVEEAEDDKNFIDMLAITSCGLLCGK